MVQKKKSNYYIEVGQEVQLHCPRCGYDILLRVCKNGNTGAHYLACPNRPQCRYIEDIPVNMVLRSLGAPQLPGI